ncbi:phosphoribosyltransferase [Aestuariivivens marinum]|uniref:phosphoribosyltransferase n=1 Tax=Aestuariivivens marinum TaxID=2913555 RepID=UPI001F595422|nr:phosphoribosyltransferase family protein [Aestuariivivens marinum]
MKVITLNKHDFLEGVNDLFEKIDVVPDVIVQIKNAGAHFGDALRTRGEFNKVTYYSIKIQRKGEGLKKNFVFKFLMKILPYSILDELRKYESKRTEKSISKINLNCLSKETFKINIEHNPDLKNILIIDDAIDTGKTMFLIKRSLEKQFPKAAVKTAVLSWTIEKSIIKPDYFLYKNVLVRFPWSKDYKGKDFEN